VTKENLEKETKNRDIKQPDPNKKHYRKKKGRNRPKQQKNSYLPSLEK
jgi:hypothetical protein